MRTMYNRRMIEITTLEAAIILAGGLFLLGWSAERFVDESAVFARRLGFSPFLIGMVIIGFGTSLPELTVSLLAASEGHADLALGNAYGSCSYNIAVILGLMALLHPLRIKRRLRRGVLPILLGATLLSALIIAPTGGVSRGSGALLLFIFGAALAWLGVGEQTPPEGAVATSRGKSLSLVIALILLLTSSSLVVWSAKALARGLGVSELAIGLTVVAAGTSLPELATSFVALRRKQVDLLLGNILGSNLFNLLAIVGLSAIVKPIENVDTLICVRDLPFLGLVTALLLTRRLRRCRAALLLLAFVLYAASTYLPILSPFNPD